MTEYLVRASREGRWWVLDVEGVGTTQARNLTEAHEMVLSLITLMEQVPADSVELTIVPDLGPELVDEVHQAKVASGELAHIQQRAANLSRRVVRRLVRDAGITGRDAAIILGVSPQRISQLLADTNDEAPVGAATVKTRAR